MKALQHIASYASQITVGRMKEVGYVMANGQLRLTRDSTARLVSALHYIVDALLQLRYVQSLRIAHGVRYFSKVAHATRSLLMWWQDDVQDHHVLDADANGSFRTYDVVGEKWTETKYLQFLTSSGNIDLSNAAEELQEDVTSDTSERADASGRTDTTDLDVLSTIPDEIEDSITPIQVNALIGAMPSNGSSSKNNSRCSSKRS